MINTYVSVSELCFSDSRDESPLKAEFMQHMIEDLSESALSYYEFLLHLQQQINKWSFPQCTAGARRTPAVNKAPSVSHDSGLLVDL